MENLIQPLVWHKSFLIGLLGAAVAYAIVFRRDRLREFVRNPKEKWNILVFDVFTYLVCGGIVTVFLVEPVTSKEAFIGGCAWEGLMAGVMTGADLRRAKQSIRESQAAPSEAKG